ncbi:hypothetical protein [Desulfitobacterium sp.]|uniref:hypothetical protein n=1 Tax=Desulfitobacterium sp. TaxID=49981 RepID=UPI002B203068|nr:hypothetical protein [Desulfitobacterium sp.]MEA4901215.1 hypothetical protein [Desulfitobacterium sp.]
MTGVCLFIPFLFRNLHKQTGVKPPHENEKIDKTLPHLELNSSTTENKTSAPKVETEPEAEDEEGPETEAVPKDEAEDEGEPETEAVPEDVAEDEGEPETEAIHEEGEAEPEPEPEPEPEFKTVIKPKLIIDPYPVEQIVSTVQEIPVLSFEELLEEGFKEKEQGTYQKAAEYFYSALKTKPEPDLAYYLITDCYTLWQSTDLAEMAFSKLEPFMMEFQHAATAVWRKRFDAWLLDNEIKL